jgi:hypothetical protein
LPHRADLEHRFPTDLPIGGGDRIRTDDRLVANQVLYQLSYAPVSVVGLTGFEPVTSRLSGERSNQLSYRPWQGNE